MGQPTDIAEVALAHKLGNRVWAAYQLGPLLCRSAVGFWVSSPACVWRIRSGI